MPAPSITYTHCPFCGASAIFFQFSVRDYVATGESFEIWYCQDCTVRFTQSVPALPDIGRYYDSDDYMSHSTSAEGWFNWLYQQARKYSVWWRCRTLKKFAGRAPKRLLDFGTGAGMFSYYMQQKGWQVSAVEPDEDARNFARRQYQLEVLPVEAVAQMTNQSFEVITLWHVLEHVHELDFYLRELQRLLTDNGTLLLAVPNYRSKDAAHYQACWDAYDVPRHLYHFSPKAVIALLDRHGFTLVGRNTFWLDPFYVCLRSERHQTGKQRIIAASWNGLKSCIAGLTDIESASAVTYVFRKKNSLPIQYRAK